MATRANLSGWSTAYCVALHTAMFWKIAIEARSKLETYFDQLGSERSLMYAISGGALSGCVQLFPVPWAR